MTCLLAEDRDFRAHVYFAGIAKIRDYLQSKLVEARRSRRLVVSTLVSI